MRSIRQIFFNGNSLWKSICKLDKNYNHKIVMRMEIDNLTNLHNLILLPAGKYLSHQMQQILVSFYWPHFDFICIFFYLTINIVYSSHFFFTDNLRF